MKQKIEMQERPQRVVDDLNAVISKGIASVEETVSKTKKKTGRPRRKEATKGSNILLPVRLLKIMDKYEGNRSFYIQRLIEEDLQERGIIEEEKEDAD